MTNWVKIVPGDDAEQLARDLLSLADSPLDVRTSSDEGLAFLVPQELADAYESLMRDVDPPESEPAEVPVPASKRRGRPRKDN